MRTLGLLVAIAMKWFYSRAGADDLNWMLAPIALLLDHVAGIPFERELRTGWISHSHRMIVGPGCAGLNFMIVAFAVFFFPFVGRPAGRLGRACWLGASLGLAWLVTITTNAIRVFAAIHLRSAEIYGPVVTPERVHRATGIVVYAVSLVLAYLVLHAAFESIRSPRAAVGPARLLVPLGAYLGMTIGAPLLTRAWRSDPALFVEHSAFVVTACLALGLAAAAAGRRRRESGG